MSAPSSEKKKRRRTSSAAQKSSSDTNVEVSGDVEITGQTVNVDGDVVGRDKTEYEIGPGSTVVGKGGRLYQIIANWPRSVQIAIGLAVAAIVVAVFELLTNPCILKACPTIDTEYILDASAVMADPERWKIAQKAFDTDTFVSLDAERTALWIMGDSCEKPSNPRVPLAAKQADRLNAVVKELQPGGDAALVESIGAAASDLVYADPHKINTNTIVVISAGKDTCVAKQQLDPCFLMSQLVQQKLNPYNITYTLDIVALRPDEETLQELTCLTSVNVNGQVYTAKSLYDLKSILDQIRSENDRGISSGVVNGSFELGQADGWTSSTPIEVAAMSNPDTPAVGKYAAQLRNGDALEQNVLVPRINQATLTVWYRLAEGQTRGALNIYVDDQLEFSDTHLSEHTGKLVATQAPDWNVAEVDVSAYAGQPVKVQVEYAKAVARASGLFQVSAQEQAGTLWVDNIQIVDRGVLAVIGATPTPTPTSTSLPTSTPTTVPIPAATQIPTPSDTPTPAVTPIPCNLGTYIADVTIPDGTQLAPNTQFVKTWRVRNDGSCQWGTGYQLAYASGDQMSGPAAVNIPKVVAPGQEIDISVNLVAPPALGDSNGTWRLRASNGAIFSGLTVAIKVIATPTIQPSSPTLIPPGPQPLSAPRPIYPNSNNIVGVSKCINVTFTWDPVPEPGVTYTAQVQTKTGSDVASRSDIKSTSTVFYICSGSYQWRVQATRIADGQNGPWSNWVPFNYLQIRSLPLPPPPPPA